MNMKHRSATKEENAAIGTVAFKHRALLPQVEAIINFSRRSDDVAFEALIKEASAYARGEFVKPDDFKMAVRRYQSACAAITRRRALA